MNLYPGQLSIPPFHRIFPTIGLEHDPPPLETINQSTNIEITLMGARRISKMYKYNYKVHLHHLTQANRRSHKLCWTIKVSQGPKLIIGFDLISSDEMPPHFDGYTFYTLKKWYAPYKYLSCQALVTVSMMILPSDPN
jgi:hypothetical protein